MNMKLLRELKKGDLFKIPGLNGIYTKRGKVKKIDWYYTMNNHTLDYSAMPHNQVVIKIDTNQYKEN